MNKISDLLSEKLKKEMLLDDIGALKIEYALTVLKNEGTKLILLFLFYLYFGQEKLFVFCAILLIPVRIFSGGLHMKTNVTCFLFSFFFFLMAIKVLPLLPISMFGYALLLVFSLIIICVCAPIATSKKPIVTREKYLWCKRMAVASSLVMGCFLLLQIKDNPTFQSGVWVFTLQAFQLMIAYMYQKSKGGSFI